MVESGCRCACIGNVLGLKHLMATFLNNLISIKCERYFLISFDVSGSERTAVDYQGKKETNVALFV